MPKRMVGTVAGVNRDKGFFFICGDEDGRDYFAWVRDLPNHRSLNTLIPQRTRFEFTPEERPKGPAASSLVALEDIGEIASQPEDPTARRLGLGKDRKL